MSTPLHPALASVCCDICWRVVPDTLMYWHRQQHHSPAGEKDESLTDEEPHAHVLQLR